MSISVSELLRHRALSIREKSDVSYVIVTFPFGSLLSDTVFPSSVVQPYARSVIELSYSTDSELKRTKVTTTVRMISSNATMYDKNPLLF